jgi:hypothetical protein
MSNIIDLTWIFQMFFVQKFTNTKKPSKKLTNKRKTLNEKKPVLAMFGKIYIFQLKNKAINFLIYSA